MDAIATQLDIIDVRLAALEAQLADLTDATLDLALRIHAATNHLQEPTR